MSEKNWKGILLTVAGGAVILHGFMKALPGGSYLYRLFNKPPDEDGSVCLDEFFMDENTGDGGCEDFTTRLSDDVNMPVKIVNGSSEYVGLDPVFAWLLLGCIAAAGVATAFVAIRRGMSPA